MELKQKSLDPYKIGLKVGFEIHQQLATKTKLFCGCMCVDVKDYEAEFVRRLRPTQSELGEYDPAALFEFRKGRLIKYLRSSGSSCLVEADEEPPHDVNKEALETVLIIALALKSNIIDEVHVMRKIVIDGSNTTGFQRTMLIANGGVIEVGSKKVGVQGISLEEDAAKLISDDGNVRKYGLDRLGAPLIEVALEPVTGTTDEIMAVALTLGRLMRASKRVSRGLGTIRQDVNISIDGGGVIEVKGVQKLDQLIKVIEYEMMRQHGLQLITSKLAERKIKGDSIHDSAIDITNILKNSTSKVIKKAIESNGIVKAVRLRGFAGMLSHEPYEGIRLGKEFGELVRFYGLGGVFHSDELPAYGITKEEVDSVKKILSLNDSDAFVIVAGLQENVEAAANAVIERARYALVGVPAETRAATNEGKTVYSRPRPGAARMYPETDIPPIPITREFLDSIRDSIPKSWETYVGELSKEYGLNKTLAEKIFDSDHLDVFKKVADTKTIATTFIASTLTESLVSLERQGLDMAPLDNDKILSTFEKLSKGEIAKESVLQIFEQIMKHEAENVNEAIAKLGLEAISDEQLNEELDRLIRDKAQVIREKGMGAVSILMGEAMKKLRGKVDGQKINTLLKEKIAKLVS
jgi:glutamyl-tRNA(Gln) amidotransferase subunit E